MNEQWEITGKSQNFNIGMHSIYIIAKDSCSTKIPNGYDCIGFKNVDDITVYLLENTVPVNATEYIDSKTGEKVYPYAGIPMQYKPRVLVRK